MCKAQVPCLLGKGKLCRDCIGTTLGLSRVLGYFPNNSRIIMDKNRKLGFVRRKVQMSRQHVSDYCGDGNGFLSGNLAETVNSARSRSTVAESHN